MTKNFNIKKYLKLSLLVASGLSLGVVAALAFKGWNSSPVSYADNSTSFQNSKSALILYGTSWCPACRATRKFLKENNIAFIDLDIDRSKQAALEYSKLEKEDIPVLLFKDRVIVGFQPKLILEAIKNK
jgi:glutaredoxin